MFDYDAESLRGIIWGITRSNISQDSWIWFQDKLNLTGSAAINSIFSQIPRKTGKELIKISEADSELIAQIKPGCSLQDWTTDRFARVCFLIHLDPLDKNTYFKTLESLFLAAEMSELVALYSSLPFLAYSDDWKMRCAEGIRSNISSVLEAIIYHNSYPAEHLDDKAWNQLVLKAFFTEKDIRKIVGFDKRANAELVFILSDYAHERWAAGRSVSPLLWRAASKFMDARILSDLTKVLSEGVIKEQQAAALALYESNSTKAQSVLMNYKELKSYIENNDITWDQL